MVAQSTQWVTARFTFGYTILFGFLALVNRYSQWLPMPPASVHQWRQADGEALAWHYAQFPDFWTPEISNLFYTGDTHAMGELPVLYWLAGLIHHSVPCPSYPLRWIGLILLYAGGWAFGYAILLHTKRPLVAALAAGLLLTSPILGYYGPSALPDAPAFCCLLLVGPCLWLADRGRSKAWLFAAALAAALAMLLKLSMAIIPLALAGAWCLGKRQGRWAPRALWSSLWPAAAIAATGLAVVAGRWWIAHYNAQHHAYYFLSGTRPVWRYDWNFIWDTLGLVARTGMPAYASAGLYLACLGGLGLTLQSWRATPRWMQYSLLFTGLGSLGYILLWFRMFREHDYYAICLLALPALLLWNGLHLALARHTEKRLVVALVFCCLLGAVHSHYLLSKRLDLAFHPKTSENLPPEAFLDPLELDAAGIPGYARVLCPQDPSPNIALLALKRPGWTAYNFGDRINADTLTKYQRHFGLTHLALRDTVDYSPLCRHFFPKEVWTGKGWKIYQRDE